MTTTSTITVNNIELKTDDNIEFFGAWNKKPFKMTKDIDVDNNEYCFTLELKNKDFYSLIGTYPSIEEAVSALK